jgi:DNA-binding GntR family transcriptional regulator
VSCRLAPGERITERVLAERFGFGLSPIRKALLRLDSEGLVSTRPRSGYRVAPLTVEDVDNIFDAWSVLGSAIIRRAAERCTEEDREEFLMYTGRVHQQVLETLQRSGSLRSHEIILDDMPNGWWGAASAHT